MVKKARYIMPQNTALQREMNYRWISRVYAREKGQLKKKIADSMAPFRKCLKIIKLCLENR